jgi:DNA-binding NarL/FixJ family response regulator
MPLRVLVVDDDARVRAGLAQTIEAEADLSVVATADTASGALAYVESARPSVALVDVLLPDALTGLGLVRRLSEQPGRAVVAISVRSELRGAALAAGAVLFVEKGDVDAVLSALRTAAGPRPA